NPIRVRLREPPFDSAYVKRAMQDGPRAARLTMPIAVPPRGDTADTDKRAIARRGVKSPAGAIDYCSGNPTSAETLSGPIGVLRATGRPSLNRANQPKIRWH